MLKILGYKENANQNGTEIHVAPVKMASTNNTDNKCWQG
jgi:hypothetical protein